MLPTGLLLLPRCPILGAKWERILWILCVRVRLIMDTLVPVPGLQFASKNYLSCATTAAALGPYLGL
jgi:hypothetical protein